MRAGAVRQEERFRLESSGQSMVETALMLPLLLMLTFNAVNFGYFFLMAINLAAAPRSGVEYSILGSETPGGFTLPPTGDKSTTNSVSYLTYQDMTGAIYDPSSGASVRACSSVNGLDNPGTSTQTSKCTEDGSATFATGPASDPESPSFVLDQVDVNYTFTPLINGTPFNIVVLASPTCSSTGGSVTCTFHHQVAMREMN